MHLTGKLDAVKVARPVWRGGVEKGLAHEITCDDEQADLRQDTAPRQLPTLPYSSLD